MENHKIMEFKLLLEKEKEIIQKKIFDSFPYPDARVGIFELIRSIDYHVFLGLHSKNKSKSSEEFLFVDQLVGYGYMRAVSLFWNSDLIKSGFFPLFPSDIKNSEWADSIIQTCGRICVSEQY